jgi:hypothetical protein
VRGPNGIAEQGLSDHGARTPAAVIVLLGFLASLIADFPGHFPPDAIWQLAQGRAGRYNTWHPPVMAWLLGLFDGLYPGAWLFVVFNSALFYGSLFAFVALERRPRLLALPLLLIWMTSPIVLIYQGVVLKDVLFANAALAGFAALAWSGRVWARPRRRWVLLGIAFLFFTLATLTRQNGGVAALFGATALAAIAVTHPPAPMRGLWSRPEIRAVLWVASSLALVAVCVVLVSAALVARSDGRPEDANHLRVLQVYDLAGAVRSDPSLPLTILGARQPPLERFLRDEAAPNFRAAGVDNLFTLPGGRAMMIPKGPAVGMQWARLIDDHPWLYLETRSHVWLVTVATPPDAGCPVIITGVDAGNPAMLARAGLRPRHDAKDDWDDEYAAQFLGGPFYSHLVYAVLLIAGLVWLAVRWGRGERGPEAIVIAAMGLAALTFTATFFVVSIDCDFRFLYFLDVAAMATLSHLAAARPAPGSA